jgi:hypothetical protein
LLNNRVKRGEFDNAIIFNGFENKAKYGWLRTAMVTAMGMVLIQMDILMRRNHGISMMQSRKLQTKGK